VLCVLRLGCGLLLAAAAGVSSAVCSIPIFSAVPASAATTRACWRMVQLVWRKLSEQRRGRRRQPSSGVGAVERVSVRLGHECLHHLHQGPRLRAEGVACHHRVRPQKPRTRLDEADVCRPGRLTVELFDDVILEERDNVRCSIPTLSSAPLLRTSPPSATPAWTWSDRSARKAWPRPP